jgi:hypothetical protein
MREPVMLIPQPPISRAHAAGKLFGYEAKRKIADVDGFATPLLVRMMFYPAQLCLTRSLQPGDPE